MVTGASTGIGAATALKLAEMGAKVALNYYQSEPAARKVKDSIEAHSGRALLVKTDVRDDVAVRDMVARTVKEFGRLDILVNNAGAMVKRVPIAEMPNELWDEVMSLNLRSAFYCSRATIPHMKEHRYGRIVNVSSVGAFTGGGRSATAYAAAKAGLNGFTRGLAKELAPFGITVNSVAPGLIDTPFHEKAETGSYEQFLPAIFLKRAGTAEEVANVIAFLASEDSSYVTGTVFHVSGGQY